jgi:hypothetical protein
MNRKFGRAAATGFAALLLAATGCEPAMHAITVASPGRIEPAADKVTVVVVQPASRLRTVGLLDGHGQLVGQLDDRSHTALVLPEGPTVLYAVLENRASTADRIEGTLVPGRVYYLTVGERDGGVALLTLTGRSPDWARKDEYLATTPRVQMDPQRVTRMVNELGDPDPILRAGDAHAASFDPASRAAHELQENDGL